MQGYAKQRSYTFVYTHVHLICWVFPSRIVIVNRRPTPFFVPSNTSSSARAASPRVASIAPLSRTDSRVLHVVAIGDRPAPPLSSSWMLPADDFKPMPTIGKGVEEVRIRDDTGIYRVIYTARLPMPYSCCTRFRRRRSAHRNACAPQLITPLLFSPFHYLAITRSRSPS